MSLSAHQPFTGYLHHWSLQRPPFLSSPDFFFSGQPQREALASLQYFTASNWKLAFLTAASRAGVSHLLDHMVSMRGFGSAPVDVILTRSTGQGSTSPLQQLGSVLGYGQRYEITQQMIDVAIQQSDKQGIHTLWCLENCSASTISIATDFAQRHRNFSVVATTLPEHRPLLQLHAGMCGMQIELESLSLQDTFSYVTAGLQQAGTTRAIFSEAAVTRLHDLSRGLIGEIAVLAESALTTAACSGLSKVTPWIIEQVSTNQTLHRLQQDNESEPLQSYRAA
ncbi:MAG TPA: hypothetical protein DEF45_25515 [Rhodopirellula sp.]|nr:MAG: hypothetical protein CBD74_04300 [Saprospirales bacterium TMED214]HBV66375.1 hypothetical protein [Rhodopirellula sp.]